MANNKRGYTMANNNAHDGNNVVHDGEAMVKPWQTKQ
jgi:hypothetical protein